MDDIKMKEVISIKIIMQNNFLAYIIIFLENKC